jgi:hypothetical protein
MFTHLSRFARSSPLRTLAGSACLVALCAAGALVAGDPLPAPASPPVSAPASAPSASPSGPKAAELSDVTLARAVLAAFDADPVLKDVNLVVSVVDRGAVIGGPVGGEGVRRRAEEVVRGVRGIRSVKNACFVQADPDPLLRAATARLRPGSPPTTAALPGVALAPSSPDGYLPPVLSQPPSDALAGASDAKKTVVQRPNLPGVNLLGAPVAPAPPGAIHSAPAPGSLTGSPGRPADIRAAVVAVRNADPRFAGLTVELKPDGGLLVVGRSAKASDAWDFAAQLRKVPGVAQVAVDQNLVK